jgi:hypothetical protein
VRFSCRIALDALPVSARRNGRVLPPILRPDTTGFLASLDASDKMRPADLVELQTTHNLSATDTTEVAAEYLETVAKELIGRKARFSPTRCP